MPGGGVCLWMTVFPIRTRSPQEYPSRSISVFVDTLASGASTVPPLLSARVDRGLALARHGNGGMALGVGGRAGESALHRTGTDLVSLLLLSMYPVMLLFLIFSLFPKRPKWWVLACCTCSHRLVCGGLVQSSQRL